MDFINWIMQNYQLVVAIIGVVCSFVSLLILIFRKKIKVCGSSLTSCLFKLPDFINQAEALKLTGAEKYTMVLSLALNYLATLDNTSISEASSKYTAEVDEAIEKILSTPQKKGE